MITQDSLPGCEPGEIGSNGSLELLKRKNLPRIKARFCAAALAWFPGWRVVSAKRAFPFRRPTSRRAPRRQRTGSPGAAGRRLPRWADNVRKRL